MEKEVVQKPPKYAMVGNTEMRLEGNRYYRDAGLWDIGFKFKDGKFVTRSLQGVKRMANKLIIEITKEEYEQANKGYLKTNLK